MQESRFHVLKRRVALEIGRRLWLGYVAVGCLLGVVVYEVALNTFLASGGLGRVLSRDPGTLLVQYSSGWSIWPGRVHARGLRIRSSDSHVQFDLRIDHCAFDVSLTGLAQKKFHVFWVNGEGIAFRARRRLDPENVTNEIANALPPIEGLERIPLRIAEPPPPDDAHYNLFTIELDGVDARSTREIWVDEIRFAGNAHVTGGFYLRPTRLASVGPARAEFKDGRVTVGDDVIAKLVSGSGSVTIDAFDPRSVEGVQILGRTSVRAALAGTIPDAIFTRRLIGNGAVAIRGGGGLVQLEGQIDHGRITAPSHAEIDAPRLSIDMQRAVIQGDFRAFASVASGPGTDQLDAGATGRDLQVVFRGAPDAPLRANHADVRLKAAQLDLAHGPLSDASVSYRVPTVEISDARVANAWLPAGRALHVESGAGTAGGQFDYASGMVHGGALVALDQLRLRAGISSISCTLRTHVVLRAGKVGDATLDLAGSRLELRDVDTGGSEPHWWATLALPSSIVSASQAVVWRSRLEATARDTGPIADLAVAEAGLPRWAAALLKKRDVAASATVSVRNGAIDVRNLTLTAESLRVDGEWTKRGQQEHLLLLVDAPVLTVGYEKRNEETHLHLLDARGWFRQQQSHTISATEASQ